MLPRRGEGPTASKGAGEPLYIGKSKLTGASSRQLNVGLGLCFAIIGREPEINWRRLAARVKESNGALTPRGRVQEQGRSEG